MKNAFGGLLNTRRHYTHSWIHETLVDLLTIQKEIHSGLFAVKDGTTCGNGPGPRTMIPEEKNILLASGDQVAIDAVAAKIMGFDPLSIPYIRLAHDAGLGCGDPRDIEVVGEDVSDWNYRFTVGDNMVSRFGDVVWFGPLHFLQKLFFRTPLVYFFVFGLVLLPRLRLVPDGRQASDREVQAREPVDAALRGVPRGAQGPGSGVATPWSTPTTRGPAQPADPNPEAAPVAVERPRLRRLGRRLVVPAVLAAAVFVALALLADVRELKAAFAQLDALLLIPVFALSLVNYALRWVRWELYLRWLEIRLPLPSSLAIFLAGFALSITPGKAGELGKAWLARELGGGPARRAVAVVLCERVIDLLAMILLVAARVGRLRRRARLRARRAGGLRRPDRAPLLVGDHAARPALGGLAAEDRRSDPHGRRGLGSTPTAPATRSAAGRSRPLGRGLGGRGDRLPPRAARLLDRGLLAGSRLTYSFSTLLGALSMLPGGLLAAEGSLTALLDLQGLSLAQASAATMVIRVATLWFAVLLGVAAAPYLIRRLRRR